MSFLQKLECPYCRGQIYHEGSAAGRTVACPDCGKSFQMPGVEAPRRAIQDDALQFSCEMYGQHPVQADGRVRGHPFYFRAKYDSWTFTVCTNDDDPEVPSYINPPTDQPGFFEDGKYQGFDLNGRYGSGVDASYMPLDAAESIIRDCVQRFLDAIGPA